MAPCDDTTGRGGIGAEYGCVTVVDALSDDVAESNDGVLFFLKTVRNRGDDGGGLGALRGVIYVGVRGSEGVEERERQDEPMLITSNKNKTLLSSESLMIIDNALGAVGHTPLIRLDKIAATHGLRCNLCAFIYAAYFLI